MCASTFSFHGLTATAGTAITGLCPPRPNLFTRITSVLYRCGATAHAITFMKTLGKTRLSHDAAASQAIVYIDADPGTGTASGNLAASDFVVVELGDGTFQLGSVSSVTAKKVTLAANLDAAAKKGAMFWTLGATGDHASSLTRSKSIPAIGGAVTCTASVMNTWQDSFGLLQSSSHFEPLMVHSANGTNAGVFELLAGCHST